MPIWNSAFELLPPNTGESPSLGASRIRDLKHGVFERMVKEHEMDLSTGSIATDGWHRVGSARVYYGATFPTVRPDGVTPLDANDVGRLWFDTASLMLRTYNGDATPLAASWVTQQIAHGSQVFLASGTFTVPTGITELKITGCAVGGNGVYVSTTYGGAGGGGGEWALKKPFTVTPGDTLTVTIGTVGANTSIGAFTLNFGKNAVTNVSAAGGALNMGTGAGGASGAGGYNLNGGSSGHPGLASGGSGTNSINGANPGGGGGGGSYQCGGAGGEGGNCNGDAGYPGYGGGGGGSSGSGNTAKAGGPGLLIVEW